MYIKGLCDYLMKSFYRSMFSPHALDKTSMHQEYNDVVRFESYSTLFTIMHILALVHASCSTVW